MQICTPINGISTKSGVSDLWPPAHMETDDPLPLTVIGTYTMNMTDKESGQNIQFLG